VPHFKVAHIREQGVDLIIIPVDDMFRLKSSTDQNGVRDEFQLRANAAELAGTVVLVWEAGGNLMGFLAPNSFHPYFRSLNLPFVWQNVNRELSW